MLGGLSGKALLQWPLCGDSLGWMLGSIMGNLIFLFSFFNLIFQWQFTFGVILYEFQVCSIVVRHSYALHSVPPSSSSTHVAPHSYYSIIDYIFYAVLYIPVTILWLPICTSNSFSFFTQSPTLLPSGNHQSVSILFIWLVNLILVPHPPIYHHLSYSPAESP